MGGVLSAVTTALLCAFGGLQLGELANDVTASSLVALNVLVPAAALYGAGARLTGYIRALQRSTEAIIAGDLCSQIEVECSCEVGELADSFRRMVGRLNSSIFRMNLMAHTDPVTGLPNRAVISHLIALAGTLPDAADDGALLFIDLDGFKRINDTLGHEAGDELLRQVADRIVHEGLGQTRDTIETGTTATGELLQTCPTGVMLARFAGDEFLAYILGPPTVERLSAIAQAIVTCVQRPFELRDTKVVIGASVGIARRGVDTDDTEQLLSFADIAMYAAKERGRGRYVFFDATMQQDILKRARLEAELRHGLERDEFVLHYQPKFDTATLAVVGAEALLRWNHPVRGTIYPNDFVGVAEQCGLMPALGERTLQMAVAQLRRWQDEGQLLPLAVNVSPAQFEKPSLVQDILATLAAGRVEPSLLELEITESMAMSAFESTRVRMNALRAAGIRITVDDFGIGFSNLSQLSQLPFSTLKVDRSLVGSVGADSSAEPIVEAIVGMAYALGYTVVAEGIETRPQEEFLRSLGCDVLQGYRFARPMPADAFAQWLQRSATGERPTSQRALWQTLAVQGD